MPTMVSRTIQLTLAALIATILLWTSAPDSMAQRSTPKPVVRAEAVFAGGCFWCTEKDFDAMPGVLSTTSGYIGGKVANPTYEQVSGGTTGHIEAVKVVYDPRRISYAVLLARFMRTIDPTDAGGSFCDRGYQYRTAIFPANAAEEAMARAALAQASKQLGQPVRTLILPRTPFWPAEEYHQDYHSKNPLRYKYYRWNCGRDQRLEELWTGR